MRKKGIKLVGFYGLWLVAVLLTAGIALAQLEEGAVPSRAGPAPVDSTKISLDLKGMDIIDTLKLLAARGNLNIVAGKDVRGRVTMFLKDVDIWDAFEIILAANDLAYDRKGDIINVMTGRNYELLYGEKYQDKREIKTVKLKYAKAADVSRSLNHLKTKIGSVIVDEGANVLLLIDTPQSVGRMEQMIQQIDLPTATRVFTLNYGDADDVKGKISEMLSKNIGSVRVDERMNKVIVTDLPEKIEQIEKIIAAFDEKTREVLIEAKIVEITLSDDFAFGINWEYIISKEVSITRNLNMSIPGTTASILGTFTPHEVAGTLNLLQKYGKTNVLSTPRITVANNEEAKILVGKRDVYITATISQTDGTTTSSPSVNFVDVGVTLSVTPTINQDGFVMMKIKPEVSSVEKYETLMDSEQREIAKVPVVTTSEAETTVLVKDGATILIAGLIKDTETISSDRIPILGHIPILGLLFTNRSIEKEKTELAIFITPHIITGEASAMEFGLEEAEERLKEVEEQMDGLRKKKEAELKMDEVKKFYREGKRYFRKGEYQKAIEKFGRVIELESPEPPAERIDISEGEAEEMRPLKEMKPLREYKY